jgi:formiminoglutamate deiminase
LTRYWAEHAWLGSDRAESGVLIEVRGDRIAAVARDAARDGDATVLRGLVLPGLANAHSHAFHRALRGRTQRGGAAAAAGAAGHGAPGRGAGSFWTWREDMYAAAEALDPDAYRALARAVFGEMALAGITCVGEFHYLHHGPGGTPYDDPNAMGHALIEAAAEAGIRITLLDTCYLASGFGTPPEGVQERFSDGDAAGWAERAGALAVTPHARIGAAIHSVRAVPAPQLATVADWARERGAPLHAHVSEQRAENEACLAAHGRTPVELLDEHGALGAHCCAVHATHLTGGDVARLGGSRTAVCMCATTERDLADGIGPARALLAAGAPLCTGSDSHAIIDPFEEARAIELDERLRTERRGHFSAAELLRAATDHGTIGWPEAGAIREGAPADLVALSLDSVRLADAHPDTLLESAVFAATAADVRDVIAGGRQIVRDGRHTGFDVAAELRASVAAVLAGAPAGARGA